MHDGSERDSDDHFLCLRWAAWHHSRKLYAPPPPKNLLAKMRVPDATVPNAPDAPNDAALNTLNCAIAAQRRDDHKMTFLCYYLHRVRAPSLMDYYHLTRAGLYGRIAHFRTRVIIGQQALMAGRCVDEMVIDLARRRRQSIRAARLLAAQQRLDMRLRQSLAAAPVIPVIRAARQLVEEDRQKMRQ